MVIITYSQPKLKNIWKDRINRIFNLVKTKSTKDLWVKILIYRNHLCSDKITLIKRTGYRGHYRCMDVNGHGFYKDEWKFKNKHPNIKHVITLKIGESCSDETIARLIAHEFRHYLQWKKYGANKMSSEENGRRCRPIQVERDARKWTEKRVEQIKESLNQEQPIDNLNQIAQCNSIDSE